MPIRLEGGSRHRVAHPFGDLLGRGPVQLGKEDREFLSAYPTDEVDRPDHRAHGTDDKAQGVVADTVTPAVVDRLEMIRVHHQYGAIGRLAPHVIEIGIDQGQKCAAVKAGGEAVLRGYDLEFLVRNRQPTKRVGEVKADWSRQDQRQDERCRPGEPLCLGRHELRRVGHGEQGSGHADERAGDRSEYYPAAALW